MSKNSTMKVFDGQHSVQLINTGGNYRVVKSDWNPDERRRDSVRNEIKILSALTENKRGLNPAMGYWPFIVPLASSSGANLHLPYYPNGDLLEFLNQRKNTDQTHTRVIFWQLLRAVCLLHSLSYAHRDISPENILLDAKGRPVLSDFGAAISVPRGECITASAMDIPGKMAYLSPELVDMRCAETLQFKYDPYKADVFSLGIVLFAVIFGVAPFDNKARANGSKYARLAFGLATVGHKKLLELVTKHYAKVELYASLSQKAKDFSQELVIIAGLLRAKLNDRALPVIRNKSS